MTDTPLDVMPSTLNPSHPSQPRTRWGKPLLALFFSLIADGLGQIYNGELIKGLALALLGWLLLSTGFGYLMHSFQGLCLFIGLSLAFKAYLCADAFVVAKKLQVDTTRSRAPVALRIGAAIVIVGIILFVSSDSFFKKFITFHAFKIPSASMCPTICEGDRIVADMGAFHRSGPRRGDVVLFLFDTERSLHIKRVAAVGGDQVSVSQGRITVNGNPAEPPASACGTPANQVNNRDGPPDPGPRLVPPGKLFLVGDNLDNSYDSRYYGVVEVSRVRDRPLYLYWSRQHTRIGCAVR